MVRGEAYHVAEFEEGRRHRQGQVAGDLDRQTEVLGEGIGDQCGQDHSQPGEEHRAAAGPGLAHAVLYDAWPADVPETKAKIDLPEGCSEAELRARVEVLLSSGGLGRLVAPGLHEAELHYLHTHEWARTADDVLWRRTKLGLHLDAAGRATVDDWCRRHWTG